MKKNHFIFKVIPDLATKSNYYDTFFDLLKNLPKIAFNTLHSHSSIPGFQYIKNPFNTTLPT